MINTKVTCGEPQPQAVNEVQQRGPHLSGNLDRLPGDRIVVNPPVQRDSVTGPARSDGEQAPIDAGDPRITGFVDAGLQHDRGYADSVTAALLGGDGSRISEVGPTVDEHGLAAERLVQHRPRSVGEVGRVVGIIHDGSTGDR